MTELHETPLNYAIKIIALEIKTHKKKLSCTFSLFQISLPVPDC